ncbi:lycopene cyclase family protein [Runella sp. MFBS21]|uniref:lycopene cyclase family protein n=1 Tax=Runella sp. MFBS21 TaxID=3034018 RepID=UPI0023F83209|nr:lycopene cyclase family protein [Runella sp. MFBS21]MDF7821471.1 lycopene cyclase family protein [Runella sp. MFBS21]
MQKYDFIIAGGGLAGLSLAYYMNQTILREKSILIIDQDTKTKNDRTWCFWEKDGTTPFDSIVHRQWKNVFFHGTNYSDKLDLGPYTYKWLKGVDFYNFVKTNLLTNSNIVFVQERIERLIDTPAGGFIITPDNQYLGEYVFDSIKPLKLDLADCHNLLQHFKGWEIVTDKPVFDTHCPTMMDYRVAQKGVGVRFMYILPESPTRAMVEYTVFSDKLLSPDEYDAELHQYIKDFLKIENFTIEHEEFGVIPMTDEPTPQHPGEHIVRIGTAGGYVKASTGYAFQRTQRFTQELVRNLVTVGKPLHTPPTLRTRFKSLMDSTLLNVLLYNRAPGKDVFTALYKKNPTPLLFSFLDEDTSFAEDFRIMRTVPLGAFIIGMLDAIRKRF